MQMISPISNINFKGEKEKKLKYNKDTLLKNTPMTRARIGIDKFSNALTLYPAKGLKGNKNANFYEFLTMGSVPYIIGSLTMMSVFGGASKLNKPALGVLFYGIMKSISKSFINIPVKAMTGVDTELPYARYVYELPDYKDDTDITSIEYHKVFESVEFPRFDLLYGDETKGEKRNFRYDKIAKKLGMGENLKDSDQEVKPRLKEIIVKSNLAKNISSYLWAATGVALAFQKPWDNFFEVMTLKFWKGKEFLKSTKSFGRNFVKSVGALYKGEGKGLQKHAGKILIGAAMLSSILGVVNTVTSSRKSPKTENIIQGGYKTL